MCCSKQGFRLSLKNQKSACRLVFEYKVGSGVGDLQDANLTLRVQVNLLTCLFACELSCRGKPTRPDRPGIVVKIVLWPDRPSKNHQLLLRL